MWVAGRIWQGGFVDKSLIVYLLPKVAVVPPAGQVTEFFMYTLMSVNAGVAFVACLVSSAHCCLAPSIWRKLLMQAFIWDVVRARTKLGIAIAARRPMMATTIMISTNVNPALLDVLMLIRSDLAFLSTRRERSNRRVIPIRFLFTNCLLQPQVGF